MNRRIKFRPAAVTALVGVSLLATACGSNGDATSTDSTGAAGKALVPVKVGMISAQAAGGFVNMAQEQDFYKDCGVDLQVTEVASGAQLNPALISGSIGIAIEGPAQTLLAIQKGVIKAKIIGSIMDGLPWAIYGDKDVKTLEDIAGKSMAVSSSTGLNQVVAQLILSKHGIDPKSVKFVNAGSNADKYKALATGVVQSASIPSDYIPQAKKDGLNVITTAAKEIPLYPRWTIIASDEFLKDHPKEATCYLAASMKGERYAFDHPDAAKALAAKILGGGTTADDPIVTDMYDQIVKDKLVNRNAELPLEKLAYQQQNLVDLGLLDKPVPLEKVYDDTYRQDALKMVGGKQ